MRTRIVPRTAEHAPAVREFNARLSAGAAGVQFPKSHVPEWLPKRQGCDLYQEHFVAIDDQAAVRGAYMLKHQWFLINGGLRRIADYQLPISEGIIDRKYALVGLELMQDALRRQPELFGMGFGGLGTRMAAYQRLHRWQMVALPFLFRVVHAHTFLQNISVLRTSPLRRTVLSMLAVSGLGTLAISALQRLFPRRPISPTVSYRIVKQFSPVVDPLWDACKHGYSLIAVRDSKVLNALYPADDPRFIRLKVLRGRKLIGWAVLLNTQMSGHSHFGNMRVGTLADCLAAPEDANDVVSCASHVLEAGGTDLMVSNQASLAWCNALRTCGFISGPSNFGFAAAPALAAAISPLENRLDTFHLNRGDGDGPINL
jgi:hypothetical protein